MLIHCCCTGVLGVLISKSETLLRDILVFRRCGRIPSRESLHFVSQQQPVCLTQSSWKNCFFFEDEKVRITETCPFELCLGAPQRKRGKGPLSQYLPWPSVSCSAAWGCAVSRTVSPGNPTESCQTGSSGHTPSSSFFLTLTLFFLKMKLPAVFLKYVLKKKNLYLQ